jgi:hypothetical protein
MFNPFDNSYDKLNLDSSPFPEGRHLVFISEAGLHISKNGKPAIEVTFDVLDPNSASHGKRLRWVKYWTSTPSLWRLANLCRACHTKIGPFDMSSEVSIKEALLDQILAITVTHKKEDYNGKEKLRIEPEKHEQITPDEAARLREEYGDTMLPPLSEADDDAPAHDAGPGYGGVTSKSAAPGNGFSDDDGIPF